MRIQEDISLAEYTTFYIGGAARYFTTVASQSQLKNALEWGTAESVPLFILGGGSNLLVSDDGYAGLVVKIDIGGVEYETDAGEVMVKAGAGVNWDRLVQDTVRRGLWGMENLSGIPGTVGAAPIQNIGAYGQEVADTVRWVEAMHKETQEVKRFANEECEFEYRSSFFQTDAGAEWVITRVAFVLDPAGSPNRSYTDLQDYFASEYEPSLSEMREAVVDIRADKFPDLDAVGTAGSFFTNPIVSKEKFAALQDMYPKMPGWEMKDRQIKIPFAWILDHVFDLKGECRNDICFFQKQPLVVVNYGEGTAEDIQALASHVRARANDELGLAVEREVTTLGIE